VSLILIDGSALFYRAHFAFINRPLTAPNGEITSVAFGFFNSLLGLIEKHDPARVAVVFDVKGKNFRHEIYPAYKAHRKPMPDELSEQLPRLRELLSAWGIAVLEKAGVEADDVIGTVVRKSAGICDPVWIYTGDKDFMQLLDARTGMLKPTKRGGEPVPFTLDDVRREYKMEPASLIEVFALAGDAADNIPGAPGIGDKTARKLILDYGSLEQLYENLEKSKLTPRLKRVLGDNKDQVYLSRDLFVIRQDLDLDLDWEAMKTVLPTGEKVRKLLQTLGLRRIQTQIDRMAAGNSQQIENGEPPEPEPVAGGKTSGDKTLPEETKEMPTWAKRRSERGYVLLDSDDKLEAWLARRDPQAALGVDTETDGLRSDTCRLVGVCLSGWDREGQRLEPAYIPVLWRESEGETTAPGTLFPVGREISRLASVQAKLGPVLASDCLKVGQNLKFDEWVLGRHDLDLGGKRFDTMLASYVLDPGRRSHGLDDLVLVFLDHRMMSFGDLFASGDRLKDILSVDMDQLGLYAAEDADFTLRLYEILEPKISAAGMNDLLTNLEMPVSRVLLTMERNGIMIDRSFLNNLRAGFEKEMGDLQERIIELAGEDFNIQSPKQLAVILFQKIGLKPIKKTATGWSTDVTVLTALADQHELPALILEYRQVAKLQNTYVETLPQLANPTTGLIHTSYNQAVAATGRLSSSDPNLQNIPVRTELGRQIRRAFVPRAADHVFLSADYSQVELRLLAHLADDPGLLTVFHEGGDVHRRTAALIAGLDESQVTAEMRSRAKAINFGVIYGMGARALARQIKVKVKEASAFIETYFDTYPGVRDFIDRTKAGAHRDGWVETLLGRRRLLPDIESSNNRVRAFQERVAVNTPIQGTAADLIKLAMIQIQKDLDTNELGALLLLQVHDELVFEVPAENLETLKPLVRVAMEGALELKVPLVVDMHSGGNWAEAHG
jgi:DNA polymerase-1